MRTLQLRSLLCFLALAAPTAAVAQEALTALKVAGDVSKPDPKAAYWASAKAVDVMLLAQPMITPRPAATTTAKLTVQAVNDGRTVAFRLRWKDDGVDEAGRLAEFSDAAAIQFPVRSNTSPPAVFMGSKDNPVHIFHWRAQYQRDRDKGKPTMQELYPNMNIDNYPMEFKDNGNLEPPTDAQREQFSPGRMAGNPQAYSKTGVDEIYAEGFSTSSVQEAGGSAAQAVWEKGEWTLVISRDLRRQGGSVLPAPGRSWMAFAVWQGGKAEVGSRKCVTMMWTPLVVE